MTRKCGYCAALMSFIFLCLPVQARAQKLVFVVRHAERADVGGSQMLGQPDPPLSAAGKMRAARLAVMLGDAGIKAIFATEFRRTQDTAGPLATRLGLTVQKLPAGGTADLISRLRKEHAEDILLVVGHSNTVPAIIKALGGPDVTIAEDEYDNLFVIVPGTGTMTRIRFAP